MEDDDNNESEDMVLFPPGTEIFPPDENNEVAIQFPTSGDAIIFYEFLRSFSTNEIELEVRGRKDF